MGTKYVLDTGWLVLLHDMGVSPQDVLRHAELPLDLLSRKSPTVTAEGYIRIWEGLEAVLRDEPTFPLRLVQSITMEVFNPPVFACMCSTNLNQAMKRLAHYKPLVGPLRLDVEQTTTQTTIRISGLSENRTPPATMMAMELGFKVQIARMATREHIVPLSVHSTVELAERSTYEAFFGTNVTMDHFNGVTFSARDAARPFLTANDAMWSIFEPQLNMRMQDLDTSANYRDRVRACLMEILASGQYSMSDVASKLAVSTRTLQRHLRNEGTSFQKELDSLREELARTYLSRSDYSSGQIAFLLGYEDPNSFFRAFRTWTGQTPEGVRASYQM